MDLHNEFIVKLGLLSARVLAVFATLPFFSKSMLGGTLIRNAIAIMIIIFLYPLVEDSRINFESGNAALLVLISKEIMIGFVLGFLAALPFWAVESVGILIDNQRGASAASDFNPLSASQASPLGVFLMQYAVVVFFISGGHLSFFSAVYKSYVFWPVLDFYPTFGQEAIASFLWEFSDFFSTVILFSAPIVIAMFLAEFGLGLVNRFAPQLNVYFLAMSLKSGVAIFVLIPYIAIFFEYYRERISSSSELLSDLKDIFLVS